MDATVFQCLHCDATTMQIRKEQLYCSARCRRAAKVRRGRVCLGGKKRKRTTENNKETGKKNSSFEEEEEGREW